MIVIRLIFRLNTRCQVVVRERLPVFIVLSLTCPSRGQDLPPLAFPFLQTAWCVGSCFFNKLSPFVCLINHFYFYLDLYVFILCVFWGWLFLLEDEKNFFKSLLNLLQNCFCFMFWIFVLEACGILAPRPGIEPAPPALEGEVLTNGPPGKSQENF